jgi:hypothetical protein
MNTRLDDLQNQKRLVEKELARESQRQEAQFCYQAKGRKIHFTPEAKDRHRQSARRLPHYLLHSRFLVLLSTPFIWMCVIPIALADLIGSIYQAICFPIYGIPKVVRSDYLAFDRHHLAYLNWAEKFNCEYCAYVNGILGYFTEIAARTEQHWCPIKHAHCAKCAHSRYKYFFDYGDADDYQKHFEKTRRSFQDLKAGSKAKTPA